MAKFYGNIGFEIQTETRPGVWEYFIEKTYRGDLLKIMNRNQESGQVNENIVLSNTVSIVADPFAANNFAAIRYIEYLGTKWAVTSVEVNYPRLTLYIGGVYNAGPVGTSRKTCSDSWNS